ncbi:hypothetical protein [Roseixanthobacter glucoisosaccharinicivorans]|uniref:hypothetical protein n=1 Tax=Roseixanthobacter glucoisosaccharinicivorans TaxID=3119923 RepID=UPI00372C9ADE
MGEFLAPDAMVLGRVLEADAHFRPRAGKPRLGAIVVALKAGKVGSLPVGVGHCLIFDFKKNISQYKKNM